MAGACTSDLSKPCPLGWRSDVNHDCLAPVGYPGTCVGRKNFHGMKHSERELWARTCDVKWSCAQRHGIRTPCTIYSRIVLPAGMWRAGGWNCILSVCPWWHLLQNCGAWGIPSSVGVCIIAMEGQGLLAVRLFARGHAAPLSEKHLQTRRQSYKVPPLQIVPPTIHKHALANLCRRGPGVKPPRIFQEGVVSVCPQSTAPQKRRHMQRRA